MTPTTGKRYLPTPYTYIFQVVIPTANGILTNQVQSMDTDGDFWWHSVYAIGANYNLRFRDADTYYLSNDYLPVQIYQTQPVPTGCVFDTPVFFPAGSPLGIDVQDTSNTANNPVKLIIRGKKMLYV